MAGVDNPGVVDVPETTKPELTQEQIDNSTSDYNPYMENNDHDYFTDSVDNEENSDKLEFLLDVSKAKEDGKVTFDELIELKNTFDSFENYGMDNISNDLNDMSSKILNNGINITDNNKLMYIDYIKSLGYNITNDILNKEGDFSITLDGNDIIEEGFFSTSLNNDGSISLGDNDLDGNINNIEISKELELKKELVLEKLLDIKTNSEEEQKLIDNMYDVVGENYNSLSNEQKIKLLSVIDKVTIGDIEGLKEDLFVVFDDSKTRKVVMMGLLGAAAIVISAPISIPAAIGVGIITVGTTLYTFLNNDFDKDISDDSEGYVNRMISKKNNKMYGELFDGFSEDLTSNIDDKFVDNILNKINDANLTKNHRKVLFEVIMDNISSLESKDDLKILSDNMDIIINNIDNIKLYSGFLNSTDGIEDFIKFNNKLSSLKDNNNDVYDRFIAIYKKFGISFDYNELDDFSGILSDRDTYNSMIRVSKRNYVNNLNDLYDYSS